MTSTILSGLLISKSLLPTLGIQLAASHAWRSIHTLSADASQILLGIHFAYISSGCWRTSSATSPTRWWDRCIAASRSASQPARCVWNQKPAARQRIDQLLIRRTS